jgi:hypothetical protein
MLERGVANRQRPVFLGHLPAFDSQVPAMIRTPIRRFEHLRRRSARQSRDWPSLSALCAPIVGLMIACDSVDGVIKASLL